MKNITLLSACILLVSAMNSYCSSIIEQRINIKNETDKTIYGGIFLTNAAGKIYDTTAQETTVMPGQCIRHAVIAKQQTTKARLIHYHTLIFSTSATAVRNKISSYDTTNFVSKKIAPFSKNNTLNYAVRAKTGSLSRKNKLKIKQVDRLENCTSFVTLITQVQLAQPQEKIASLAEKLEPIQEADNEPEF